MATATDPVGGLAAINALPAEEQAAFWKASAQQLGYNAKVIDPSLQNDFLGAFYDGTSSGLEGIFSDFSKDGIDGKLDKAGLSGALSECLHFFHQPGLRRSKSVRLERTKQMQEQPNFDEFCQKIGMPLDLPSFADVVRRLRIGGLLSKKKHSLGRGCSYQFGYSNEIVKGSFVAPDASHTAPWEYDAQGEWVQDQPLKPQMPMESTGVEAALLSKRSDEDEDVSVSWLHLHRPKHDVILAFGQKYQLEPYFQSMAMTLKYARAQMEVAKRLPKDGEFVWSKIIMPSVFVDKRGLESLQQHRIWLRESREVSERKGGSKPPPKIHVGIGSFNLAVLWTHNENRKTLASLISVASQAAYMGSWNTECDEAEACSKLRTLLQNWFCCSCCCARRRQSEATTTADDGPDGSGAYQKLPQEEEEKEEDEEHHGKHHGGKHHHRKIPGEPAERHSKARDDLKKHWETEGEFDVEKANNFMAGEGLVHDSPQANASSTMEDVFKAELNLLGEETSRLRRGTHVFLVSRMVLSRTSGYLEALELYTAAITRIQFGLRDRASKQKEILIAKCEVARFELSALQRTVEPFSSAVLPNLLQSMKDIESSYLQNDELEYRKVSHNLQLIGLNLDQFGPQCNAQIERCKSLIDQYDREAADRVNNILNILTYITFLLTPFQILTGLYGMNFQRMPELEWRYGYHYFWCLGMGTLFVCAIILKVIFAVGT